MNITRLFYNFLHFFFFLGQDKYIYIVKWTHAVGLGPWATCTFSAFKRFLHIWAMKDGLEWYSQKLTENSTYGSYNFYHEFFFL